MLYSEKNTSNTMEHTVYLDNAATTCLDKEVLEAMMPYLTELYGNPSSTYSYGRTARLAIETARKSVAASLGAKPKSILFTSCGTESNNMAIAAAIRDLGCTHIITSPIEHHAVLHAVEHFTAIHQVSSSFVTLKEEGLVDYADLEAQLQQYAKEGKKCLVSLMHANNEIGNLLDMQRVSELCAKFGAIFHADCVQTVGHYPLALDNLGVHFASGSGHKFHGPKGTGILYIAPSLDVRPFIQGGGQERNLRAGTENVAGIVGFAKALALATANFDKEQAAIGALKSYMKQQLQNTLPQVSFNGIEDTLYTVLSVCFPKSAESDALLLQLDMEGICVSGGSACSSGGGGSHVMRALNKGTGCNTIRFSFSKYNTQQDVDRTIEVLERVMTTNPVAAV